MLALPREWIGEELDWAALTGDQRVAMWKDVFKTEETHLGAGSSVVAKDGWELSDPVILRSQKFDEYGCFITKKGEDGFDFQRYSARHPLKQICASMVILAAHGLNIKGVKYYQRIGPIPHPKKIMQKDKKSS